MSNMKKFLILGVAAPMFALILVAARIYYVIDVWKYQGPEVIFEIKPGDTFSGINYRLGRDGLVNSTKIFHRYCKINGLLTRFKSGKYQIPSSSNMLDVINILVHGTAITSEVTIPEGKNMYEIATILENKKIINSSQDFIKMAKDPELLKELDIAADSVEGYLYPETYKFTSNSEPTFIIKSLVKLFRQKTSTLDFSKSQLSSHQVIILASIVEKETGAKQERPIIAGVFMNRLKKRMRLQSDPTTIYGIWEKYKGNLKKEHLLEHTPYNTYKIGGLPAGPISNPGIDSIKAVLEPKGHDYLYFVSQNDGTHIFSKSYSDHLKAVEHFQKNGSNREGKSWRNLRQ